nr:immunoglobulin light chain junction region [Macaca mulatta]
DYYCAAWDSSLSGHGLF